MKPSRPVLLAGCAAALCTLVCAKPSLAIDITIDPSTPVAGSNVQVIASATFVVWLGTDCSQVQGASCALVDAHSFAMAVNNYVITCNHSGGCGDCTPQYELTGEIGRCDLGTLAVGHYDIQVTTYEGTYPGPIAFPSPTGSMAVSFDVTAPTPVRNGTWGRLKQLYR